MGVYLSYRDTAIKSFLLGCGVLIIFWSQAVILGSFEVNPWLMRVVDWSSPITLTTALLFLCCGGGLLAVRLGWLGVTRGIGLTILLGVVILSVSSYVVGNWEFDGGTNHLPEDSIFFFANMALNTDIGFTLVGLSFWSIKRCVTCKHGPCVLGVLNSLLVALAAIVQLGYFSQIEATYAWRGAVSCVSALAFMAIGASLLLYNWGVVKEARTQIVWLSLSVVICILSVTIGFAEALWVEQKKLIKNAEIAEAFRVKDNILRETQRIQDGLGHLGRIGAFNQGALR